MNFTTDKATTSTVDLTPAVQEAVAAFKCLAVDEQLGLLWMIHQNLGSSINSVSTGTARLFLTQGLLYRIKQMSNTEQLRVMRDLVTGVDTPITRQYGILSDSTKLVFWYQLFEWMYTGEFVTVATAYQLSDFAAKLLKHFASLDLEQQMAVVCQLVTDMGVNPLVA
ncbi:orange carotenoid protein N-terminal domain-containing protein [Lyngbya aestuarii]|uniref:orange carotenoid protein N-terminal domain-containing protein n=1 Tax=Lyngbya aestuarii TaxID=118322 RepID=UPI00403D6A32